MIWVTKAHISKNERMAVWRGDIWRPQNRQPWLTHNVMQKAASSQAGYALSQTLNFQELVVHFQFFQQKSL